MNNKDPKVLKEKYSYVIRLRELDKKTFREMAESLKVCPARAHQLYRVAKRSLETKSGLKGELSTHAVHVLENVGMTTKEEVKKAILSGKLRPCSTTRAYGRKTHSELCKWSGVATEDGMVKYVKVLNVCPHCGKRLI